MAQWRKIGVVDAIPAAGAANSPEGAGAGDGLLAFKADQGNMLEISGRPDGGDTDSTLTLLRWMRSSGPGSSNLNAAGEWRRWRADNPINFNAGKPDFGGLYEHPEDDTNYWLLLIEGMTASEVLVDAQCVHYRGRK